VTRFVARLCEDGEQTHVLIVQRVDLRTVSEGSQSPRRSAG